MSACSSVLELLLPGGSVAASTVIGSGCPDALRPSAMTAEPPWDIIVLAPSQREQRSSAWIDVAAETAARSVSSHGLVYVIAPLSTRLRLGRALNRAGLSITSAMLHLPNMSTSSLLLPLEAGALREAATRLVAPGVRRATLRVAVALLAARWLRFHPSSALVARRPGAGPLAGWAPRPSCSSGEGPIAAVRLRRNVRRERVLVHLRRFGGEGAVAKAILRGASERDEISAEAAALEDLAAAARSAGAEVPSGRMVELASGCGVLIQEVVGGIPAAWALRGRRGVFEDLIAKLAEWLERWGSNTRVRMHPPAAFLQDSVLKPAEALADLLPDGIAYVAWLERCCRALEGRDIPFVATHGDLTMSNILLRPDGRLGIVDWEAAAPRGLPLADFYYAAVDAAAAQRHYRDRSKAFDRCFQPEGSLARVVRTIGLRLSQALEVTDEVATIAFHACWLQHAEDARRKRAAGEPMPFLAHLRQAARHQDLIRPWRRQA